METAKENPDFVLGKRRVRGSKATRKSSHTLRKSWQYFDVELLILILSCKRLLGCQAKSSGIALLCNFSKKKVGL